MPTSTKVVTRGGTTRLKGVGRGRRWRGKMNVKGPMGREVEGGNGEEGLMVGRLLSLIVE